MTKMVAIYCPAHHDGQDGDLCAECREFLSYARARLRKCPYGENKPTCANCPVHCYKPDRREQVRKIMQKRRDGGSLTAEEQKLMRSVFQGMRSRPSGGGSGDYRFGGEFWVVLDTPGREIRKVTTGVTDLDRVQVLSGLDDEDRVLILPSSHLLETQQDLQNFINRRIMGVPGIG